MSLIPQDERSPSDQRYEVIDPDLATVEIKRANGDACHVKMLDLSRQGIKIVADCCIPTGETISLRFDVSSANVRFEAAAKICWARPTPDDSWHLACSLESEIPADTFEAMGVVGLVEQRSKQRHALSIPVTMRWELRERHVTGTIVDATDLGVCIQAPECGSTGDRVQIRVPLKDGSETNIVARAAWTITNQDGQRIGCRVIHGFAPEQLEAIIRASVLAEQEAPASEPSGSMP